VIKAGKMHVTLKHVNLKEVYMTNRTWLKPMIAERPILQPWILPSSNWPYFTVKTDLENCVEGFEPISLQEMDAVALLDRVDIKFMMTRPQMLNALQAVQNDYLILSIENQRMNHYRTLYFDTPEFKLFELHVNENADIYKVRCREYIDTDLSFLEVKHKTRKGRTIKERMANDHPMVHLTPLANRWLKHVFPYDAWMLEPKLWNTFTRITLVSKHCCERVTLDTNLCFYSPEKQVQLEGLAVAEVKMNGEHQSSPFIEQMKMQRIHPDGFSKYCVGVSMLFNHVKKNAMKPKVLAIEKIIARKPLPQSDREKEHSNE
jgi:hypothetical protein